MKWHVYKQDDPNTWPQIDCPMVVCDKPTEVLMICVWDKDLNQFCEERHSWHHDFEECYYAYIGYVPSGYKASYPTKCAYDKYCPNGFDDDGYCMNDRTFACKYKRDATEYWVEKKAIWKEFK